MFKFETNAQQIAAQINEQISKLQKYGPILTKRLRPVVKECTDMAKARVYANAPVLTGRYKGSIKSRISTEKSIAGSITGRVTATRHGYLVEEGRKPGKMPKPGSILNMITGGGSPEEEWRQAFALAKWIAKNGARGLHVFQKAWDEVSGGIPEKFKAAIEAIAKDLEVRSTNAALQELGNGR